MSPGITELQLTDVSTISIPTDAILILSLLIVFALLGYFFQNVLDNQTNQFITKVDDNSHLKFIKEQLDDQLTLEAEKVNHKQSEKPSVKKLKFLLPSKFLGIGSLAVVAIGGSSLLRIQTIPNSNIGVNISQDTIKTKNQSTPSLLSMAKMKSSNQSQTQIKKINYVNSLLSTINSSKKNNFYQIKEKQAEDFFSF